MIGRRVVVHGDFSCPWSYLASRRVAALAARIQVDWRAVQRDPPRKGGPALAGFLPRTRAAVTGYAEAYGAGLAAQVRHPLFEAFWLHGVDLGDRRAVRALLIDVVRSGSSPDEPLWAWGYGTDRTGGPVTASARRRIAAWQREWRAAGSAALPLVTVDDAEPLHGRAALDWLGAAVLEQVVR